MYDDDINWIWGRKATIGAIIGIAIGGVLVLLVVFL